MTQSYYTAFAYHGEDDTHRRSQRRHADPECARRAAEKLVPKRDCPWEWEGPGAGTRGHDAGAARRPTDERATREEGDWELVVRKHRAPNLR